MSNPTTEEKIPLRNFAAGVLGDFLEDYNLTQKALADALGVPAQRINDVLAERRAITPELALRLGRYFGNRAGYWLDLQNEWLLRKAAQDNAASIESITPVAA